eukprot:TRINITY_DN7447_c1_g1_i2.p1 TRINITY_DN7447_c1_g1~~TRINITY_DN7447_c1_g1_i2.p1  ORF type:complete len:317 (-),score=14.86 TRINITY_DN7447_c1_g1_i2:705-1655(-)
MLGCVNQFQWDYWHENANQQCYRSLQNIRQNYTWIDEGNQVQVFNTCQDAYSNDFFSLRSKSQVCSFIHDMYNCGKFSSYSSYCTNYFLQYTSTIGKQLISTIRYLLYNDTSDPQKLALSDLDDLLNVNYASLQKYAYCDDYSSSSNCGSRYYQWLSSRRDEAKSFPWGLIGYIGGILALIVFVCIVGTIQIRRQQRNNNAGQDATGANNVAANAASSAPPLEDVRSVEMTNVSTQEIINALPTVTFQEQDEFRSEKLCSICIDEITEGQQTTIFPCAHWFHLECAQEWINTKGNDAFCPLCHYVLADAARQNQHS